MIWCFYTSVIFVCTSLLLRSASWFGEYYTFLGFHVPKQSLSYLFLFLAVLALIPAGFRARSNPKLIRFAGVLVFMSILIVQQFSFNHHMNETEKVRVGNLSPLMMAAYQGNLQVVDMLVRNGANVDARNSAGSTALHFAAGGVLVSKLYRGSPAVVAYLLDHGADVNAHNDTGTTPLMAAVYNANVESVRILLAHGADVNMRSQYDPNMIMTPLP
jgi:hypothetical protein